MMIRRLFFLFNVLAVLSLLIQGGAYQTGQASAPFLLDGTFSVIWGDGSPDSGESFTSYFLSTAQNGQIQLILDESLLASAGGVVALNRQSVVIQGVWVEQGKVLQVQSIELVKGSPGGSEGVSGPQPWVSILCKFSDVPDEPNPLDYFLGMYSDAYPGLDHFWRQNSYDIANLEGSNALGWYTLPNSRSYYVYDNDGDGEDELDWGRAANDCTAVADSFIDFTPYVGINLMFNANLDCCAWGGSWWLCLDGICQYWRMTWEPPWGYQNIGVIAHETGHGFGLPHSLGNCQGGYDNRWDVLSDVWSNGSDPIYGTMGQHTISFHKELLEWIEPPQMFTAGVGTVTTITLERLALPQSNNYLGARISINGQVNYFYTVEVRQPTVNPIDYDKWLPGFAVIIHEVDVSRPEPAVVIDQDDDCNTGDAGAMWVPGETFADVNNGIYVSVNMAVPSGYVVTIRNRFTLMADVDISGDDQGYVGESIPFTATVSPIDATTPITYVWEMTDLPPVTHTGDTVDNVAFAWAEPGTKTITVTASNDGGTVIDTHSIEIVKKIPIVTLAGPASGVVGDSYVFTATVVPTDVVQPITYLWQASGHIPITHTGGLSDTVPYVWEDPGTQAVTVTVINVDGSTTDSLSLSVRMPPASLVITGTQTGDVQGNYTFTATVTPLTTTIPITYIWTVDAQLPVTHTNGLVDTATFSWDTPGVHHIIVSATNPAGSVEATWSITIYVKVYLPVTLR